MSVEKPAGGAGPRTDVEEVRHPVRAATAQVLARYEDAAPWAKALLWIVVIALAAAIPSLLPFVTADSSYWTLILVKIGIAALLALGLNVVVGFAGLLDLGYVAFFAVGAYSFAILSGAAKFAVVQYQVTSGALKGVNPVDYMPHWTMWFW